MHRWLQRLVSIGPMFAVAVASSLILFLLFDDTSEYILYIFALTLTLLIILQIRFDWYSFKFRIPFAFSRKTIDYVIIACAFFTLISNYFDNPVESAATVSSIITVLFVPGWVFIRIFEVGGQPQKKGITIVVSFVISIGLSGIISTFTLIYQTPGVILAFIYLIIAVIPVARRILTYRLQRYHHEDGPVTTPGQLEQYKLFDILLLIWILFFFSFVISVLYPEMSKVTGLDIVRHYSESKSLLLAPDIYSSVYPWYHMILASILHLSSSPMLLFQTASACLSFMLIFAFYIMARMYLESIDRRAPILATVMFSVFSGFGWLHFLEKIPNPNEVDNSLQILNYVFGGTYFDIGYGQSAWMWLWFRPGTLGLIILFAALSILKIQNLGRSRYIIISSLFLTSLIHVHISEFVVYVLFVFVVSLFVPGIKLRLKESSLSVVISLTISSLFIFSFPHIFSIDLSTQMSVMLACVAIGSLLLTRFKRRPFYKVRLKIRHVHVVLLTLFGLFVYALLLIHWFINADNFVISQVSTLYGVPWQFYPMLLGVTGIFAIASLPIIIRKYREHPIAAIVLLFILMVCVGRLITYVGLEYGLTGYFERRMVLLVFASGSMLAPIAILAITNYFERPHLISKTIGKTHVPTAALISSLVIIGTLSLFLSIEYQIRFVKEFATADSQIEAIQGHINREPFSSLLTLASQSNNIAQFSSPGYLIGYWANQMWPSMSPELSLSILSIYNNSFIYLQGNDRQILTDRYQGSYLDHLVGVTPTIYRNNSEEIFHLPSISAATPVSSTVLVLPDYGEIDRRSYFAYDILSLGGYNYTTAFISDLSTISEAKTLIAPSEAIGTKIEQYKQKYGLKYEMLIVLNLEGYGNFWMNKTNLRAYDIFKTGAAQGNNSNYLMDWIVYTGGHGNIGKPTVVEGEFENPLTGRNVSEIIVGPGNGSTWQISKDLLDSPLNLTDVDFLLFDWYGRGDGKWYVIQFTSDNFQNTMYRFQDSVRGWTRIILPLNINDGRQNSFGVLTDKYTDPGASWSNIIRIDFIAEDVRGNGKFYIDGFFFGKSRESDSIKYLSSASQITTSFPTNVDIFPFFLTSTLSERALYDGTQVPFIVENKSSANHSMYYINAFPFTEQILSGYPSLAKITDSLGQILDWVPLKELPLYKFVKRDPSDFTSGGVAAFDKANFRGNVDAYSSSAIINNISEELVCIIVDGKKSCSPNIGRIIPIHIHNVTVHGAKGGTLGGGYGFYSSLIMNEAEIKMLGDNATIIVELRKGGVLNGETQILSGNEIQVDLGKSSIILRQPKILSHGDLEVNDLYAYGELRNRIPVLGEDLNFDGKTSFNVDYAGESTVVSGASLNGNFLSGSVVYPYDELASLSGIFDFPYARYIVIVTLLLAVFSIYTYEKRKTQPRT